MSLYRLDLEKFAYLKKIHTNFENKDRDGQPKYDLNLDSG